MGHEANNMTLLGTELPYHLQCVIWSQVENHCYVISACMDVDWSIQPVIHFRNVRAARQLSAAAGGGLVLHLHSDHELLTLTAYHTLKHWQQFTLLRVG